MSAKFPRGGGAGPFLAQSLFVMQRLICKQALKHYFTNHYTLSTQEHADVQMIIPSQ